jgi:hypothetical protein
VISEFRTLPVGNVWQHCPEAELAAAKVTIAAATASAELLILIVLFIEITLLFSLKVYHGFLTLGLITDNPRPMTHVVMRNRTTRPIYPFIHPAEFTKLKVAQRQSNCSETAHAVPYRKSRRARAKADTAAVISSAELPPSGTVGTPGVAHAVLASNEMPTAHKIPKRPFDLFAYLCISVFCFGSCLFAVFLNRTYTDQHPPNNSLAIKSTHHHSS